MPGELRGLEYLHTKYGVLPWATVLQPAINTARYGFPVTEDLVSYMRAATTGRADFLSTNPTFAIDFAPNGTRVGLGDILTLKRYANTLETIAQKGADAFYTGAIANATVKALRAANGTMTLDDLANYKVAIRPPAEIDYRGYKITSGSAPSSGVVAMSVLKAVSGYDGFGDPAQINLTTHRLDEAIRFGYGQVSMRTILSVCAWVALTLHSERTSETLRSFQDFKLIKNR